MVRLGRPVEAALQEVDALLTLWGQEMGGSIDEYRLGWAKESTIGRIMRQGLMGAAAGRRYIAPLNFDLMAVERAVKHLPKATRRVIRAWYRSADRLNRVTCLAKLDISSAEFTWRLRAGREQVAELLGLGEVTE